MTVEALATFLNDLGVALIRLSEGLDDRPRASVTPIAPDSPGTVTPGVEPVGASTGVQPPVETTSTPPPAQPHHPGSSVDTPPAGAPTGTSTCPDCGKRCASPNGLGVHRARAHGAFSTHPDAVRLRQGPKPPPDPCPHCGFQAARHTGAARHARHCTPETAAKSARMALYRAGERVPLECSRCGYVAKGGQGAAAHARHCKAGTETATKGRGDDLDRTEADGGQPTLASGAPDGPVGHDHGGAPSEPKPAIQRGQESDPPGPAPTSSDDGNPPLDDTWTGDQIAAELASSEVENPVLPGRPTSEDLDPLDPGRLRYRCPDCDAERDELIDANFHRRQHGHGQPVKFTAPTRSRA